MLWPLIDPKIGQFTLPSGNNGRSTIVIIPYAVSMLHAAICFYFRLGVMGPLTEAMCFFERYLITHYPSPQFKKTIKNLVTGSRKIKFVEPAISIKFKLIEWLKESDLYWSSL